MKVALGLLLAPAGPTHCHTAEPHAPRPAVSPSPRQELNLQGCAGLRLSSQDVELLLALPSLQRLVRAGCPAGGWHALRYATLLGMHAGRVTSSWTLDHSHSRPHFPHAQDLRGTRACRWPADLARLARRPGLDLLLDSEPWAESMPVPDWTFEPAEGGLPWEVERQAAWRVANAARRAANAEAAAAPEEAAGVDAGNLEVCRWVAG